MVTWSINSKQNVSRADFLISSETLSYVTNVLLHTGWSCTRHNHGLIMKLHVVILVGWGWTESCLLLESQ